MSVVSPGSSDMTKVLPEKIIDSNDEEEKLRPIVALVVISLGFMLVFISYICMLNLLSSISLGEGFGTASQSVLYAFFILSALLLTPYIIRLMGLKRTIAVSALLYTPYITANFYPNWYTFLSTAAILGVAGAALWAAMPVYVTKIAKVYAARTGRDEKKVIFIFFGVFMAFFQSANIWGNYLSYRILRPEYSQSESQNSTVVTEDIEKYCGVHFCDSVAAASHETDIQKPDAHRFLILTGITTGISITGALILFFLLPSISRTPTNDVGPREIVWQPLQRLKMPYHILLVPITILSGMEAAFFNGDFTKAYIACSSGVHQIGLVAVFFGVMDTLGSLSLGFLTRYVHRSFIIAVCCLLHLGIVATIWLWVPSPDESVMFYVVAGAWGLCDSVFQSQTRALYGILFPDNQEAAFALQTCLLGVGQMVSFSYSNSLCTFPKLCILGGMLSLSFITYVTVEIDVQRKLKKVHEEVNEVMRSKL